MSAFAALGGAHLAALDPIRDTEKNIKKALARDDWRRAYAPERRTISTLDALIAVESVTQYDIDRDRVMRKRKARSAILAATRDCTPAQKKMIWSLLREYDTAAAADAAGLASAGSVRAMLSTIGRRVQSGRISLTARQMALDLSMEDER